MSDNLVTMVKSEITKALSTMVPDRLMDSTAIEGHQDLLEFVDSFGFVQLLMAVEEPLGVELDLTTVDLGSIVRFDDLTAFILESANELEASSLAESR